MMKFLKKRITLRINLIWTAVILLLIVGIAICLYLRVPDNLYFILMEPDWVSSGQVAVFGKHEWREMTREEIAEVVSVLNEFRFEGEKERVFAPDLYDGAQIRLYMNSGKILNIHCFSDIYGINEHSYRTSKALRKLDYLWRDKYRYVGLSPDEL